MKERKKAMIKGVLFDMDGVLIDSERISRQIFVDVCAELGYTLLPEDFVQFLGCTRQEDERIMKENYGQDFPFDFMYQEYRRRLRDAIMSGRDITKPHLAECFAGLRARGIKIALATSTARVELEKYLPFIPEMQDAFDATVCGIEAGRSKPFPDIFLEAARRLGLEPAQCVGVEDSLKGLQELTAAGCVRVMIPDLLPCEGEAAQLVDYRLDHLGQLCGLIDRRNLHAVIRADGN